MRNLSILSLKIVFFILVFLKKARNSVFCSIEFFLTIIYLKIVTKAFFGPTNLIRAQNFYIYKSKKVVMIYKNKNFIFLAF